MQHIRTIECRPAPDIFLAISRCLDDCEQMSSMRLRQPITSLSAVSLPIGFLIRDFVPVRHARAARALLNECYATGAGEAEAFDDWWPALQTDPEYAAELCLVVQDTEVGALAAFVHCWTSALLKILRFRLYIAAAALADPCYGKFRTASSRADAVTSTSKSFQVTSQRYHSIDR